MISAHSRMYDDIYTVFGDLDDQRDQIAAVFSSKTLEPKTLVQLAFRCAMTTRPHTQSAITEGQFYDFACFAGFATGVAVTAKLQQLLPAPAAVETPRPDDFAASHSSPFDAEPAVAEPRPKPRLFTRIGRIELQEIFAVCVRSQGVMNDQCFALAVAHMQLVKSIADSGKVPHAGSKSMRLILSEASDLLSAYTRPRTMAFPFPVEYYDSCSTTLRCLWKYSEGLENIFRNYCGERETLDRRACEACLVDMGIIPQLSQQSTDRLFAQVISRSREGNSEGLSVDGFFELLARVAASLYADDLFSRRVTLESKVEHLATTVLAAAYQTLYGCSLPCESGDIPQPVLVLVEPSEFNQDVTSVRIQGDYFGALGRGMWLSSTVSPHITHIHPSNVVSESEAILPLHCDVSFVPWDECVVFSPLPHLINFTFRHKLRMVLGNTLEDVMHRCDVIDGAATLVRTTIVAQLSQETMDLVEKVFEEGCSQLAYNKSSLYDFCWEYLCSQYCIGAMVSVQVPAALGVFAAPSELASTPSQRLLMSSASVLSPGTLLMRMFTCFAREKEDHVAVSKATPPGTGQAVHQNRPLAMSLQSFTEVLCRLAVAAGCTAETVDGCVRDMLQPMVATPAVVAAAPGAAPAAPPRRSSRGGTYLTNEQRVSEVSCDDVGLESGSSGSGAFRSRSKSFRDNDTILRTVATEQRVVKVLRQANSELKSKLDALHSTRRHWDEARNKVQTTITQLGGLLDVVLPAAVTEGAMVNAKLAVAYRRQILEICDAVVETLRQGDEDSSERIQSAAAVKDMVQQHLEELRAPPKSVTQTHEKPRRGLEALSKVSPKPSSVSEDEHHQAVWHATTELKQTVAEQNERIGDLESLLHRMKAEKDKAENEVSWVRSAMLQQRSAHEKEVMALKAAIHDRTLASKSLEEDKRRAEAVAHQLEAVIAQRKGDIIGLETLLKQKEEAIELLTTKLADAVTRSVQQSLSGGGAMRRTDSMASMRQSGTSVLLPAAEAEGAEGAVGGDPLPKSTGRRRSSVSVSRGTRRGSTADSVSSQALMMRELEAVRASEREFLRGRVKGTTAELEKEAEAHAVTRAQLEATKTQNAALSAEVRRLYDVLRDIDVITSEQIRGQTAQGGHLGADAAGGRSPGTTTGSFAADVEGMHGGVRTPAAQRQSGSVTPQHVAVPPSHGPPDGNLPSRSTVEPLEGTQHSRKTPEHSHAPTPSFSRSSSARQQQTPPLPTSSRQVIGGLAFLKAIQTTLAAAAIGSFDFASEPSMYEDDGAGVRAAQDLDGDLPLPLDAPRKSNTTNSAESQPLLADNGRAGSGGLAGQWSSLRKPHEGSGAPQLATTAATAASSRAQKGGAAPSARHMPHPKSSSSRHAKRSGSIPVGAATSAPRCPHCFYVAHILQSHHALTKRCIDVLRFELDRLRRVVVSELQDGFSSIRDRGDLVLKATHVSSLILGANVPEVGEGTCTSGGDNLDATGPTAKKHLPAIIGGGTLKTPNGEITTKKDTSVPKAATVLSPTSASDRMSRLSAALSALSTAALSTTAGDSLGYPIASSSTRKEPNSNSMPSEASIISQITDASLLEMIKGDHIQVPRGPALQQHWIGGAGGQVPPSPFAVGYSRILQSYNAPVQKATDAELEINTTKPSQEPKLDGCAEARLHPRKPPSDPIAPAGAIPHDPQRALEGSIHYRMLLRDKSGAVVAVDRPHVESKHDDAQREKAQGMGKRKETFLSEGRVMPGGADDDGDADFVDSRVAAMVRELLNDAATRRRGVQRATSGTSQHRGLAPEWIPEAPSAGRSPMSVTTTASSARAASSRLGQTYTGIQNVLPSSPRGVASLAVQPVQPAVSLNTSKLEKVRSDCAADRVASAGLLSVLYNSQQ